MFVLRSSISVQVIKKIFGIINKWWVQININKLEKNQNLTSRWGTFISHSRVLNNDLF